MSPATVILVYVCYVLLGCVYVGWHGTPARMVFRDFVVAGWTAGVFWPFAAMMDLGDALRRRGSRR